jgi:excisionase family DNA binding protein
VTVVADRIERAERIRAVASGELPVSALPLVLDVPEVAVLLGVSRGSAYECVRRGEVPSVSFGRSKKVSRGALISLLGEPTAEPPEEDE